MARQFLSLSPFCPEIVQKCPPGFFVFRCSPFPFSIFAFFGVPSLSPSNPIFVLIFGQSSPLDLKNRGFLTFCPPHHKPKTPCSEKCTFLNKGFSYFCRVCVPFPTAFITTFRSLHLKHNTFFLFFFYFQVLPTFPLFCSEMYTFLNKTGLLQTGRFVTC